MGKRRAADPSLKGKKPINTAKKAKSTGGNAAMPHRNPSHIRNKIKRSQMYGEYLTKRRNAQRQQRLKREKEAEALGEEVKKATPRTLESTREVEPTAVVPVPDGQVDEVAEDEADDEFAPYFSNDVQPKVLITTRPRPSQQLFYFIADLQRMIPSLHFHPRKSYSIKEICQFAGNRDFTHLVVLSEKSKVCNGFSISHLRQHDSILQAGPTAFFKVTNVVTHQNIPHHGASTHHVPELNLHGFGTRLGHRVGRLLGSLFPHAAEFRGRQVCTFHNQRDYIFCRAHRYVFRDRAPHMIAKIADKDQSNALPHVQTKLQELGPRFTLKLRWLQEGTFDTQNGEYEWIHKRKEMDTTRRKFHL